MVRNAKNFLVALCGLMICGLTCVSLLAISSRGDAESQVAAALGCRDFSEVLVLDDSADGRVSWPDGAVESVERSCLLLQAQGLRGHQSVVGLLAKPDVRMAVVRPLMQTAQDLGMAGAIFAMRDDGTVQSGSGTRAW